MTWRIPYVRPWVPQCGAEAAYLAVMQGHLADGYYVQKLEEECAIRWGGHWVACSSGTAALVLCREANEIKWRIGVPDFTFRATFEAFPNHVKMGTVWDDNAQEWLCEYTDFHPKDPWMDRACRVTLGGFNMRVNGQAEVVISDDCQSFGVLWPKHDCVAYSFSASKVITCGHGGIVRFESKLEADHAKRFRNHGKRDGSEYVHDAFGFNYNLADPLAAMVLAQLPFLRRGVEARWESARSLRAALRLPGAFGATLTMPIFESRKKRDEAKVRCLAAGIEARGTYPGPLQNEAIRDRSLFLPSGVLSQEEQRLIASTVLQ